MTQAFRLDHVAIAVRDLEEASAFYGGLLGLPSGGRERVEEQSVDVAFYGEEPGRIELLAPFREGAISRFLDKRGEGLHHVAVRVTDLDGMLTDLKARGVPLIDETARTGAHGTRVAFVHPRGARGVLLELVEVPDGHVPGHP